MLARSRRRDWPILAHGSARLATISGTVRMVNRSGSSFRVTSSQHSGMATGARVRLRR